MNYEIAFDAQLGRVELLLLLLLLLALLAGRLQLLLVGARASGAKLRLRLVVRPRRLLAGCQEAAAREGGCCGGGGGAWACPGDEERERGRGREVGQLVVRMLNFRGSFLSESRSAGSISGCC